MFQSPTVRGHEAPVAEVYHNLRASATLLARSAIQSRGGVLQLAALLKSQVLGAQLNYHRSQPLDLGLQFDGSTCRRAAPAAVVQSLQARLAGPPLPVIKLARRDP